MTPRRGYALAAVLATLVIMAMVVAISAQRALVAARQGALDLARAEMAVAAAGAQSAVLDESADSARIAAFAPGVSVASGMTGAGSARARWTLAGSISPYATIEIEAWAPVSVGTAREVRRALVAPRKDASGEVRWVQVGGGGWARLPSR